jgi:hypothetical protein
MARAEATTVGSEAWAGLGWTQEPTTGRGLFVELHGGDRTQVDNDIELTLDPMIASRPLRYGDICSSLHPLHGRSPSTQVTDLAGSVATGWASTAGRRTVLGVVPWTRRITWRVATARTTTSVLSSEGLLARSAS